MMRFLAILGLGTMVLAMSASAELKVRITGLKNDRGFVRALLFVSPEGFPEEPSKAKQLISVPAKKGEVSFSFKDWKGGSGVVVALHDETDAKKLRKNLLGIPKDGIAVSGWNQKGRPKFQDCVGELAGEITIPLKHF